MKRPLIFVFALSVFLALFSVHCFAEEPADYADVTVEYKIEQSSDKYRFLKNEVVFSESESLDDLIDGLYALNEPIYLDNLRYDGDLSIEGNITACGTLNVRSICVSGKGELTLEGLNLTVSDGIEISGGRCSINDCTVLLSDGTVALTSSSSSELEINLGSIKSDSNMPTLLIERGSAFLNSGKIENQSGTAITNKGDLHLGDFEISGTQYDIITENAIWMSADANNIDGTLDLKYNRLFEQGTSNVAVYATDEHLTNKINVYDKNGKSEQLRYRNGGICIYKPFVATFVYADKSVTAVEYLRNQKINMPSITPRLGYDFVGWSSDINESVIFDFSALYNGDITLYEVQRLKPPQYSINGINEVYNGNEFELSFSKIRHDLAGVISYTWYSESGDVISTDSRVKFKSVNQSGRYKCKLLFTFGSDSAAVETPYLDVVISPKIIVEPTVDSLFYNGSLQYPQIEGTGFDYNKVGFLDAGCYSIELTLSDKLNTRWLNSNLPTSSVQFEMLQADNAFIDEFWIKNTYNGAEILWSAKTLFGEAVVMFSETLNGEYSVTPPVAVGKYYAIAKAEGNQNYKSLISEPLEFSILHDSLKSFTVKTHPAKSVYTAFELFDTNGLTFDALYESGKRETVYPESVTLRYLTGDCFSVLHNAILAEFGGHTLLLPVKVIQAEYDMTLAIDNQERTFNSLYQTLIPVGAISKGKDGSLPTFTVSGGGTDVGRYTVTVEFKTDSIEYKAPASLSAYLDITPLSVNVIWSNLDFVYDGEVKCPSAYYFDAFGFKISLAVEGGASLASEKYTATAISNNPNYCLTNATADFSIERATYDMSGVFWSQTDSIYSGDVISVTVNGLPSGVNVVGYINNTAINAGEYCATAVLSGDERNYYPPENVEYRYTISKSKYRLDGFSILGGTVTFDGELHYPTVNGSAPCGADGIPLELYFSHGVLNVYDNPEIVVHFKTESENYICPTDFSVNLSVIPMGIYVEWNNTSFTYNGTKQQPYASSEYCKINVLADAINAGNYTATAVSDNQNYAVLNPYCDFIIDKVANFWTVTPQIFDIFYGNELNYNAESGFGEVLCDVYVDLELSERAEAPLSVGKYYAVIRADAGDNYFPLTSSPLSFNVIPIMPVSLMAQGKADYTAFDCISSSDLTVTLINNDGSLRTLGFNEIDILYQNADSFRAKDEYIKIKYGEISLDFIVTVNKADYDLSGAVWSDTDFVYDGNTHTPRLCGLPNGVTVKEYLGGGAVNSGEYEITAILSYDTDNYNMPQNPTTVLKISKRGITPSAKTATYNGLMQSPIPEIDLYYFEESEYRSSGTYYVGARLIDSKNYYLTEAVAEYVILPKPLYVRVNDSDAYWFEEAKDYSLSFEQGITDSLDEIGLEYYVSDGLIYVKASNQNYELLVTPGRVIRHNRFSPRATRSMFISFLMYLIIISAAVIIVIRREDVYAVSKRLFKRRTVVATSGGRDYPALDFVSVDVDRANALITDSIAKTLIKHDDFIITSGRRRCIINVDTLSDSFSHGDKIDINVLKAKGLVPSDAGYLKVLGRGSVDKQLNVYANAFSLSAVKMIALTGGSAVIVKNKSK